ncbi:MAG: hypothetical protein JOZ22_07970 [Acidobacteriia bacterium]|nr:hypothetical protein [Terriglobia bacterium]
MPPTGRLPTLPCNPDEVGDAAPQGPTPLYTAKTPEEIKRWVEEVETPRRAQSREVETEYFAKLAEGVHHKRGRALAISLETLIARGPQPAAPEVLRTLLENFGDLLEMMQRSLLGDQWSRIASPSIEPVVRSLAQGSSPVRDLALARLQQFNPAAAREIALERIRRGDVMQNLAPGELRALLSLPDKTLPQFDDALLTALEAGKPVELLVARYASEAALPRMWAFLAGRTPRGSQLLAYLLRVDAAGASGFLHDARARPSRQAGWRPWCVSNACRQEVSDLRRWFVEPIAIDRDEPGYARLGPVPLRSRAQLEQKVAQFPSDTKFALPAPDGTWYSEQRRKDIAAALEKAGMQIVDGNRAR